jgi:hypothetical protein
MGTFRSAWLRRWTHGGRLGKRSTNSRRPWSRANTIRDTRASSFVVARRACPAFFLMSVADTTSKADASTSSNSARFNRAGLSPPSWGSIDNAMRVSASRSLIRTSRSKNWSIGPNRDFSPRPFPLASFPIRTYSWLNSAVPVVIARRTDQAPRVTAPVPASLMRNHAAVHAPPRTVQNPPAKQTTGQRSNTKLRRALQSCRPASAAPTSPATSANKTSGVPGRHVGRVGTC